MRINNRLMSIAFAFGLVCISLNWFAESSYLMRLTKEDGLIENLTASFYFIGFIICIFSIVKSKQRFLPILWAVLCFVFLGEETSWFQRLFDYSVPAVEAISYQNEFNFHNLETFQMTQRLFELGFFGYFLFLPLLMLNKRVEKLLLNVGYVKLGSNFVLYIFIIFLLSFILTIISPEIDKRAIAETREMLYGFFILIYIVLFTGAFKRQS